MSQRRVVQQTTVVQPVRTNMPPLPAMGENHHAELEALCTANYQLGIGHCVLALIMAISFWAAYFWPFVLAILSLTIGIIALNHYKDVDTLFTDACC